MTLDVLSIDQLRLQLPRLLEAIGGDDPAGTSLREAPEIDHLREARREDDTSLPAGIWQAELKRGNWAGVETLACQLLTHRSKDLMVAVWLGESWIQRYQLSGLCVGLELIAALCERFNTALFPRSLDDSSWLPPPLAWMARHYSDLLNIRLPLLGAAARGFENLTLDQWMQAQQQALKKSDERKVQVLTQEAQSLLREWREVIQQIPVSQLSVRLETLNACSLSVDRLNRWSEDHLCDDAPSFAQLQKILNQHIHALQEFIAMHPEPLPVPVSQFEEAITEATSLKAPIVTTFPLGAPNNRQVAYQQLKVISDYLKRVEPHSPVPYLINRAVDWGNMELPELLSELIKADPDVQRIWKLLGVLP
jgi:type VI secretion system protein ImpA